MLAVVGFNLDSMAADRIGIADINKSGDVFKLSLLYQSQFVRTVTSRCFAVSPTDVQIV